MLLFTEDQTRAVGVGPDVLSVHMLRPYQRPEPPEESGWDEFRPRIATALKAYWDVAEPVGCPPNQRAVHQPNSDPRTHGQDRGLPAFQLFLSFRDCPKP